MKKVEFVSESGNAITGDHTFATEFLKKYKAIVADAMEFACNKEDKGGDWKRAKNDFLQENGCSQGPLPCGGWFYKIGNDLLEMKIVDNAPDSSHYYTATLTNIG